MSFLATFLKTIRNCYPYLSKNILVKTEKALNQQGFTVFIQKKTTRIIYLKKCKRNSYQKES
ncbi:hypothetical protein BpHYR1_043660 [Brachionus plicatilis]|uniref:Uncharacterized protein n=1 Tax=Brachionus plicatilis TaxID=10195 RepID=A0A3M7R492_BRAPC|nr:hypothetical protein BpHYR1_043660 [Brachionus plicatilis]